MAGAGAFSTNDLASGEQARVATSGDIEIRQDRNG